MITIEIKYHGKVILHKNTLVSAKVGFNYTLVDSSPPTIMMSSLQFPPQSHDIMVNPNVPILGVIDCIILPTIYANVVKPFLLLFFLLTHDNVIKPNPINTLPTQLASSILGLDATTTIENLNHLKINALSLYGMSLNFTLTRVCPTIPFD